MSKRWIRIHQSFHKNSPIDYSTKKETTLRVGHFDTISGHFSANYINIFHKTGVLRNISRCLTCRNLNWIKSYNIRHNFIHFQGVFKFGRRKKEKLPLINGHFMTIFGHFYASYIEIFHKTEVQKVILRCLVCLNLTLIQSYNILLVKKSFS